MAASTRERSPRSPRDRGRSLRAARSWQVIAEISWAREMMRWRRKDGPFRRPTRRAGPKGPRSPEET
jgi:hypothetical protein